MVDYGKIIAKLRKDNNLTQAELGEKLNVTCQAVSKWENNQSQPDFGTMAQIADLFNVPLTIFQESNTASTTTVSSRVNEIVGYCKDCGNAVTEDNLAQQRPVLLCKDCFGQREKAKKANEERIQNEQKQIQAQLEANRQAHATRVAHARNRGLIWAAVITVVVLVLSIFGGTQSSLNAGVYIGGSVVFAIFLYTFVAQLFWNGFVVDTVLFGGKIVGMPGVIFTFDLDGFIFLVAMKILFALLKMLIFIITFLIGVIFAMIVSPFTFVPALLRVNRGELD